MENDLSPSNLQNVELQNTELHDVNLLKDSLRANVESYLMTTYSWHMTPEKIEQNFRGVLSILDTQPTKVVDCLSQFDRSYFAELLTSRGVFTQGDIQAIASQLDTICLEKILTVRQVQEHQTVRDLKQRIEVYLVHTSKEQLFSNSILPAFQALLESDIDYETLTQRLQTYDRQQFRHILMQRLIHRQDITYRELESVLDALEATRNAVLSKLVIIDKVAHNEEVEPSVEMSDSIEAEESPTEKSRLESIQGTAPSTSQVTTSNWSTWDQIKWKPTVATQQSTLSNLSWSTWAQLSPKPNVDSPEEIENDADKTSDC